MVLALVSPHAKVDCPLAAAAHLPRAAPDLRRPAHREHTAPAVYAGSHHRRNPDSVQKLAASTRLGVKEKIYRN